MIFFLALENFYILDGAIKQQFFAAPYPNVLTRNPPDRVYCTTVLDLKKLEDRFLSGNKKILTQIVPEDLVRQAAGFPAELGVSNYGELEKEQAYANPARSQNGVVTPRKTANLEKQISRLRKNEINVAILNGMGTGIGDTLAGLTALAITRKFLERKFKKVNMDALIGPQCFESVAPVYAQSPVVDTVRPLPITLADLWQYDAFFDTGSLMHREDADRLPYVDFFLKQFGIDYWKIEPARKRNNIYLNKEIVDELDSDIGILKNDGRKLLLFHPTASGDLRSIPEKRIAETMEEIIANSDYRIITVVPIPFQHERVTSLTEKSKSFQHLCAIVSRMDAIVTVDTSIYHIADAFNVPALVLFTTIDPGLRVKYYPTVKGMLLAGARESGYFGRHALRPGEDADPVQRLWDGLQVPALLEALRQMSPKARRTPS